MAEKFDLLPSQFCFEGIVSTVLHHMDSIVFTSGCCLIAALPKENPDFWAAVSCLERAIWNMGVIKD